MQVTLTQTDGLHLNARAALGQLAGNELLSTFADGLLTAALTATAAPEQTLAAALHHPDRRFYPLLAALLALDAEVSTVIDDARRVFPLSGFLSYRARLPLEQFPPSALRLPPLNSGGHYLFSVAEAGRWVVVRADIHPELRVAGHVRVVLSETTQPPRRLNNVEHRLDRQALNAALLEAALAADAATIAPAARRQLAETLQRLLK